MKKTISLLLIATLLLGITVACFSGCDLFHTLTIEEAEANLKEAGYTVTIKDGAEYAESDENTYYLNAAELDKYLYAEKGEDVIYMFFFNSIDLASHNYEFMIAPNKLLGGQSNNLVYFATRQARKDAKL